MAGQSCEADRWFDSHETHSGAVVLVGERAYKLKRPVNLGFLDFTDLESRWRVCRREVELNRRLAPDVYLGVGSLQDPAGHREPVVVMRRMPEDARLSHLVRSGRDVSDEVRRIARAIAAFHQRAETSPHIAAQGTRDALRARWDTNLERAAPFVGRGLDHDVLAEIAHLVHRFLDGRDELFNERIGRGAIVDGHGDLTADDVFCLSDGPRLLDCLEFDDRLRYVDRLDDIAFLAMGLEELGAPEAARILVERWTEHVGDTAPPSLLHHFVAYRAFVRAMVGCLRGAHDSGDADHGGRGYADTALAHLRKGAVSLVLVGGLPASGKSTLAGAVADRLGMVTINSDRVRKELAGLDPMSSAATAPFEGLYQPTHTRATYQELLRRAELLLGRGESVVLDASWTADVDRRQARHLATRVSADMKELRCEVDAATASTRLAGPRGPSDADARVTAAMRRHADPWPSAHVIDTRREIEECVRDACAVIRPGAGAPVPAMFV